MADPYNPLAQRSAAPAAALGGGGGALPWVTALAGPAVAGGGLIYDIGKQMGWWGGNTPYPGQQEIQDQAAKDALQSQQLESYIMSGTLPPGMEAQSRADQAAVGAGMASDLASTGVDVASHRGDIATREAMVKAQNQKVAADLFRQGVDLSKMSSDLYKQIMDQAIQQDQQLSSAIGNFASALATVATPLTGLATGGASVAPMVAGMLF